MNDTRTDVGTGTDPDGPSPEKTADAEDVADLAPACASRQGEQGDTGAPSSGAAPARLSHGAELLKREFRFYMRGPVSRQKGYCYPSEEDLAKRAGKSVRTIRRYIAELVAVGWLRVERGDRRYRNHYYVVEADPERTKMSPPTGQKCPPGEDKNVLPERTKMSSPRGQKCPLPLNPDYS
jgi:Helix-turn-helix domain